MLKMVVAALILILAVILYTVYLFLKKNFNGLSWEEIVFHLKVPMKGTSNEMILDYFRTYGIPMASGVCLAIGISVVSYMMFSGIAGSIMLVAAIVLLIAAIYSILASFDTFGCLVAQRSESDFIEKEAVVVTPELLHFPEKKRNLVYIFLESMESTFSSKEEGGAMEQDRIPELTALAKEGVNFSSDEKLGGAAPSRGASWTTGAMVSQTCGYPLMISLTGKNYKNAKNAFMPGAGAIGDVLEKEGYAQEIMVGSDLTFGGRKMYFEQHGDYKGYDYPYAKEQGKFPKEPDPFLSSLQAYPEGRSFRARLFFWLNLLLSVHHHGHAAPGLIFHRWSWLPSDSVPDNRSAAHLQYCLPLFLLQSCQASA